MIRVNPTTIDVDIIIAKSNPKIIPPILSTRLESPNVITVRIDLVSFVMLFPILIPTIIHKPLTIIDR